MSSDDAGPPGSLTQLLDCLSDAGRQREQTSFGELVETVGARSFGPLLILAGLIAVSPISGIPGVPTLVAVLVALIAAQLLLGRRHFWLPRWLMRRTLPSAGFRGALERTRRPAGYLDRIMRPRLVVLTGGVGARAIAVLCLLIAATMPPLELVPFSATIAGAALTAFGLALIAHDGLFALIAVVLITGGGAIVAFGVF